MQNTHKEAKSISSSENQQTQEKRFFQTYKNYSDNFQRQVEKTVTQRNELFGKVYLEYLKHYKQVTDKLFEHQDNFLTKNGLKVNTDLYNDTLKKFYESASMSYSNQAKIAETTLNVMEQNLKLLNGNLGGFTDLVSSIWSWWIPVKESKN